MEVTRRRLLSLTGAGVVAGGLAACTTGRPESPGPDSGGNVDHVLPAVSTDWPIEYDLPPSPDGIVAAFLFRYPDDPPRTASAPPGTGTTVTAACQINTPIPTPMDRNPAWQAINEGLNTTLAIQYTPAADWDAKLQSLLAGGNLPDITQITSVPRLPELLPRRFADLTEHLAGDAVAAYPNLARLGDAAWRNVIHGSAIYGVPQPRSRAGGGPIRVRSDIADDLGVGLEPSNGAEFVDLLRAVADPRRNRWATAAVPELVTAFADMLDAPNGWREVDGRLVNEYESDQYVQALDEVATLWQEGILHPDAFTAGVATNLFDSGQSVLQYGTFDPGVRYVLNRPGNPDYAIDFLVLPKFDGGGASAGRLGSGYYGMAALNRELETDRVTELLGILDWLAAPLGTAEALICKYGVEGRHYTIEDGIVTLTDQAGSEVMITGYLATPPTVYFPTREGLEDVYRAMHAALETQYAASNDDPTHGLYSETQDRQGGDWDTRFEDLRNDVIQGRRTVAEFQEGVVSWRTEIGDTVRGEYESALEEQ